MQAAASPLPQDVAKDAPAGLRGAIEKAISDSSARQPMRLFTECLLNSGMRTLAVYGDGIGIWDSRRQFKIAPDQMESMLQSLNQAKFASMPEIYGGPEHEESKAPPQKPPQQFVVQVTCRVELDLAGHSKQVFQRAKGKQNKEFRKLAEGFFQLCEPLAKQGVEASSLSDGLNKLASKELSPHSLRLMMHRQPDERSAVRGNVGFLLRIAGDTVTSQSYDPAAGYTDPLRLNLSESEFEALAKKLAELDPGRLPGNLYANDYTDLNIRLLNQRVSVQARQFSGMSASTHGEKQKSFDGIYALLRQLHLRVVNEGKPVG